MKKEAKPTQSLVSLMRQLRAMLPAPVKKLEGTEYLVVNRAIVKLNYHCNSYPYETKEERLKKLTQTCFPSSVTVSAYGEGFNKELGRSGYNVVPSGIFHAPLSVSVKTERSI